MFNEKIFLFLWFWFAFLFTATTMNIFYWLLCILRTKSRFDFVRGKLTNLSVDHSLKHFCSKYLRPDDIFVLKMISNNASEAVVTELIQKLYSNYNRNKMQNLTLSICSNSVSSVSYPSKPGTPTNETFGNILVDLDPKESMSFKETLYQPLKPTEGKEIDEGHIILKRLEEPHKKYSAVSSQERHMKKHRSWIGGKKLTLVDRRKLEKMSFKIGADDEDDMEGSGDESE